VIIIKLSKNDLKLIKYLYECEFLTRKQIKNYVWENLHNVHIRRRLPKLRKNNYIQYKDNPFSFVNEKYVYMLDYFADDSLMMTGTFEQYKKMCDEFNLNYIDLNNYTFKNELDDRRLNKQYHLNNVRFKLEEIGVKNWIPYYVFRNLSMSNKIKKSDNKTFDVYPDGIVQEKNLIGIELERKIKPRIHYRDLFVKYDKEDLFKVVIFVTYGRNSGNIYNGLQGKLNPEFSYDYDDLSRNFYNKFFVIKYSDLMNGNYDIYNKKMDKTINIKNII